MYTNKVRVILAGISLIMGILSLFAHIFYLSVFFFLFALFQIYGYFAYSGVWLAFKYMKRQDFKGAKSLLEKIKNPNLLSRGQKGYYYFILGNILLYENNFEEALINIKKAVEIGLRTKNDISISYLIMAQIYFCLEKYNEALLNINKAGDTPHKEALNTAIGKLKTGIEDRL